MPRKNIKLLGGKPLIYYTIEAARSVFKDEVICVSTDDLEIKDIVEKTGLKVPFLRPTELSTDLAGSAEVIDHAINFYEFQLGYVPDTIILLQPTSPFRNSNHIVEALKLLDGNCDAIYSVIETKSNPYFVLVEESPEGWLKKMLDAPYTRRQDLPTVYELNGAIYIYSRDFLKNRNLSSKIRKFVMDKRFSLDIDEDLDFKIAEFFLEKNLL